MAIESENRRIHRLNGRIHYRINNSISEAVMSSMMRRVIEMRGYRRRRTDVSDDQFWECIGEGLALSLNMFCCDCYGCGCDCGCGDGCYYCWTDHQTDCQTELQTGVGNCSSDYWLLYCQLYCSTQLATQITRLFFASNECTPGLDVCCRQGPVLCRMPCD